MKCWPFFDFFIIANADISFLSTIGKPDVSKDLCSLNGLFAFESDCQSIASTLEQKSLKCLKQLHIWFKHDNFSRSESHVCANCIPPKLKYYEL